MTLLAPLFLLGFLAIGLPIWLHRLSSENPNRKQYSSLMFLEAGEPRRVLAKNLQYLLLLALRIGVLALVALAFAQPALWREPGAVSGGTAQLHVIVLDASASMSWGDRWERAQDAALDVIGGLAPDDRAQLVSGGRVVELLTGQTIDRALLRQGVAAARPGVFFLDYGQLARAVDGVLRGAELPVVLHLITDGQEGALPTRFAELAPTEPAELRVHNVAADGEANWAVESLVGSTLTGEVQATVRSFASMPVAKMLSLELNGLQIDERRLEIEPGGRANVNFGALELASGANRVSVSLTPGDDMTGDDTRIIALKRAEPRPVLLLSGDLRMRDTLFVSSAMESLAALALVPETAAAAELVDRPLADYGFVVVADAGALGDAQVRQLEDYVANGGALLMALGPRTAAQSAVPLTGQQFQSGSAGLFGGDEDYASVGALDATHPALQGVELLRAARFFRHTAIEAAEEDRILISLDTGSPLLLERELGAGRVLVFTSSLDREWNDLPVQPVFVPLVAGIANHLLGGAGFSSERSLGSTLALRAVGLLGGQIFDPAGDPALGLGGGSDDVLLDRIGFYEIASGGNTDLVAVNFDIRESDLATVDAATIERWESLGQRDAGETAAAALTGDREPVLESLAQWILIVLLVAVILESWIGNQHLRVRRGMAE